MIEIAAAPSSQSSTASMIGAAATSSSADEDSLPPPHDLPRRSKEEKTSIVWIWIFRLVESICIALDRIFMLYGVYAFLLADIPKEEEQWQKILDSRRKRKKKNDKSTSSIKELLELHKSQQIEGFLRRNGLGSRNSNSQSININVWEARELALSHGGLVNDTYRQILWPYLLGISSSSSSASENDGLPDLRIATSGTANNVDNVGNHDGDGNSTHVLNNILDVPNDDPQNDNERHIDACIDLIRRDAGRSVVFRYTVAVEEKTSAGDDNNRDARTVTSILSAAPSYATQRLVRVLENVIRDGKKKKTSASGSYGADRMSGKSAGASHSVGPLHYYQGLHDIAGVILHTLDYDVVLAKQVLSRICQTHLRDATRENFSNVTLMLKTFLPPLIQRIDVQAYQIIVEYGQVDIATVCLPWVITWFTHDLHDPDTASRLVDIFISSHPILPMYMCAALITNPAFQNDILQADYNDPAAMFLTIKRMPLALRHFTGSSECEDIATKDASATSSGSNVTSGQDDISNSRSPPCIVSLQEVLEDALAIMNRINPRSLIDLVVDKDIQTRHELTTAVSKIAAFRPTLLMTVSSPSEYDGTTSPTTEQIIDLSNGRPFTSFVHAKLASGIPIWMNDVSESPTLTRSNWGSEKGRQLSRSGGKEASSSRRRYSSSSRKQTKLQKLVRNILGKKKIKKMKSN